MDIDSLTAMYIPFISTTVPAAVPGPYKRTGYALVRAASSRPYTALFPKRADGTPVFDLDGVTFAVYYPTDKQMKNTVQWAPPPVDGIVDGYEAYFDIRGAGLIFYLMKKVAGRFKIPISPNAPIAAPAQKYPLVIFSHGLSGTRNTYSQYCQALASEGYVVLAIEHRDGSGPMFLHPENGKLRVKTYAALRELLWEDKEKLPEPMRLRGLQLDYRVREVYETYEAFKSMVSGGNKADVEDMTDEEASKFFASLRDTVDIENLKIGGHSFGGGTTFRVLQTAPPEGYDVLPIKHAVSLDPWLEPFPFVDERPTTNTSYPPNLSINSQEYTEWEPHFSKVTAMCKEMEASFVSITGLTHEGFSDQPVIASFQPGRAQRMLHTCHKLTMSLFNGQMDSSEFVAGYEQDGGVVAKTSKGKLLTKDGEVLVHLV